MNSLNCFFKYSIKQLKHRDKLLNMVCDYYIQSELIIEYIDMLGRISFICTNRELNRGYVDEYLPDHDSDDDEETCYEKYMAEIEKKIKENTYDKILFNDGNWIKESYKKNMMNI